MIASILQIHAQVPLLIASTLAAVAVAVLMRLPLPRLTRWLLAAAVMLTAAAAGDLHTQLPHRGDIMVMVDLSPSTRTATYRDRAALDARLKQLLGTRSYRVVAFADEPSPLPTGAKLTDLPAVQTTFAPPAADAVVLLSDGRFDLPVAAPPTYAVIDPGLYNPLDVAIDDVRVDAASADVVITGRGNQRVLTVTAALPTSVTPRETSVQRVALARPPPIGRAELNKGDVWPENDTMSFAPPQQPQRQRWWVSTASSPEGWTVVLPEALAASPEDLLTPSIIALDNVPIDALPPATQDRLQQYVRDLGGSLLILGGDRSFAAGGYTGSVLDALSPLASDPPTPTTHWLLLTDASGSMAGNRWTAATGTLASVVRELPGADLVSVGSFAADLQWWTTGTSVADARRKPLPPVGVAPNGSTNLEPVLQKLVATTTGDLPTQLLLLTDGETLITSSERLAVAMKTHRIRLHVVAVGDGPALSVLKAIAEATGGAYTAELDAGRWLAATRRLLQAAREPGFSRETVDVRYNDALPLSARMTSAFNRTWLKPSATELAKGPNMPLAARWQVGNGQVAAVAFTLQDSEREAAAALIARPPRDPRFRVDWLARGDRVIVDAADGAQLLNGLSLDLDVRSLRGALTTLVFKQSAPGRYALQLPPSTQPRLAVLRLNGREIDRRTFAGRYAREFAGIGTDEANLRELARRTGGRVIGPAEAGPILPTLWRDRALTPWLGMASFLLIAAGMLHWKRS